MRFMVILLSLPLYSDAVSGEISTGGHLPLIGPRTVPATEKRI